MNNHRRAADALGEIDIEPGSMWGAQTQRARAHFDIGGEPMPRELLHALLLLKGIAALVNAQLGRLPHAHAQAIEEATAELMAGGYEAQFPLSVWQSGSGTQSHMNVNEVVAYLAGMRLGHGQEHSVHAHDEVNLGQSSNDMVPSAMHLAAMQAVQRRLMPALEALTASLGTRAALAAKIIKLGRTHLQDAVPMTAGQEIGAWRSQLLLARSAVSATLPALQALAVGATAVGTGLNTHPDFGAGVCRELSRRTGITFVCAPDRFAALAGHEPLVALHGSLKVLAVALFKMANDVRLLASGPRGGLAELLLPANEPGSSIMPGKINPTQCEALAMVCCQVMGNDLAVTLGAAGGHLQLNTYKPLIASNVLRSIRLLGDAMASFDTHTVRGMVPDAQRMREWLSGSLMLVTALTPHIGYDRAAQIAQRAHTERTSLREAALALGVSAANFDLWTEPQAMLGNDPNREPRRRGMSIATEAPHDPPVQLPIGKHP